MHRTLNNKLWKCSSSNSWNKFDVHTKITSHYHFLIIISLTQLFFAPACIRCVKVFVFIIRCRIDYFFTIFSVVLYPAWLMKSVHKNINWIRLRRTSSLNIVKKRYRVHIIACIAIDIKGFSSQKYMF